MVGRCLCAITYVLAFPAAAILLEFVGEFMFGASPPSWGGGWRYMIPAGLVVGGLALVIEKGLYRFVGLWPQTWALFWR
jgi:hypothetical protein